MSGMGAWPRGLRIVFWLVVVGLLVGIGQALYWMFIARELYFMQGFVGIFNTIDFIAGLASVMAGVLGKRRIFRSVVLGQSLLSGAVILWVNAQIGWDLVPDLLSQPFSSQTYLDRYAWYLCWNMICLGINGLIAFYICYHEFSWFRRATADE